MPCGKKPLVKKWEKPREIRTVKPSRYQQNEASVKVHWMKVMRDMELFYKDEQFWETQAPAVRDLVGPVIFARLTKIFNLHLEEEPYAPKSETSQITASENYYTKQNRPVSALGVYSAYSFSDDYDEEGEGEEDIYEKDSEEWSVSSTAASIPPLVSKSSQSRNALSQTKSFNQSIFKSFSKVMSKAMSRTFNKSFQRSFSGRFEKGSETSSLKSAFTLDDLLVHVKSQGKVRNIRRLRGTKRPYNPHFDMLYCNESETDMIKWNSNYKQKTFEVSASDEYSKKAELLTKQIAHDFYEWWTGLGSVEFKSEIKRPVDIEDLFQVWFDEHASHGLVLDPKIMPCVLESIANYVGVPRASCPRVLKRQVAKDIHAETSPAHTMAFGQCLPIKNKHIPPQNNTKEIWHCVKIPEDLYTMAAVWEDISHLTATKAFQKWLSQRQHLPMPPFLREMDQPGDKKQLFVIPSDYIVRDKDLQSFSAQDLNIPVSQFSLEIKEVLSRLLND